MTTIDDDVKTLLGQLVGFDTTSRNSNLALIEFIESYLAGHGVTSTRIDYEPGVKTNLYATIGPDREGGVALSGHTDVVPVDGQDWSTPPFDMTERDGRVYGRGTADMKGFIAVALAMVPVFARAGLKVPIHLAFSCDEEVGCIGVRPMIAHIADNLPRPKAVIVGEPTSMRVVNAHKGSCHFHTEVTGHEAHSSATHHGVNAIMVAGEIIGEINRAARDMRERGDPSGRFEPPFTSVHIGTISGGTARNIIPRQCILHWETRLLPDASREEIPGRIADFSKTLLPDMHAVSPETGISTQCTNAVPGLRPDPRSPAEALAFQLTGANDAETVAYSTEAGLFQQAGIPAVVCGPGDIAQAHKPDEFIALSELTKCAGFMHKLADYCARPPAS